MRHKVLQCVAVCCSVLQRDSISRVTGRELQCVAVCCSVLQCVIVGSSKHHEPLPLVCDCQTTVSLHNCNKQPPLQHFPIP